MSGGQKCQCSERKRPLEDRAWVVVSYRRDGRNGGPSEHSNVECRTCGLYWKTGAAYVDRLVRMGKTA